MGRRTIRNTQWGTVLSLKDMLVRYDTIVTRAYHLDLFCPYYMFAQNGKVANRWHFQTPLVKWFPRVPQSRLYSYVIISNHSPSTASISSTLPFITHNEICRGARERKRGLQDFSIGRDVDWLDGFGDWLVSKKNKEEGIKGNFPQFLCIIAVQTTPQYICYYANKYQLVFGIIKVNVPVISNFNLILSISIKTNISFLNTSMNEITSSLGTDLDPKVKFN